jgi:hypothetical protein
LSKPLAPGEGVELYFIHPYIAFSAYGPDGTTKLAASFSERLEASCSVDCK